MQVNPSSSTPGPALPPAPGVQRRFQRFCAAYILVWLVTWYGASVLDTVGGASLWYLPGGLRFACLLMLGWTGLGLELATSAILLALQTVLSGTPAQGALPAQLADLLYRLLAFPCAYAAVIFPLRRYRAKGLDLARTQDSALLVLAALGVSALSALAGTVQLAATGSISERQWQSVFSNWMLGDLIGVLTLAPLLLVRVWPAVQRYVQHGRWAGQPVPGARPVARGADTRTVLITLLSLLLVMGTPHLLGQHHHSPILALLLLLPLALVAMRFNLRGAVLAVALIDSGLVLMVALVDHGALALHYQLEMVALALVGLWLGGTVEAGRRLIQRLKDFSSVSNDLLWEVNLQGQLTFSGRLAEQMAVVSGAHWRAMLQPLPQPGMAQLEAARAQRQPFSRLEVMLPAAGDQPRWLSVNGIPLWDAAGEFAGYRGTASDISDAVRVKALLEGFNQKLLEEVAQRTAELKHMNTELSIKEQHLGLLLATVPVGVLELDARGCCLYLNAKGSALCGCSPEAALGQHLLDFVHADDRETVRTTWEQRAPLQAVQSLEFRLHRSNTWCSAYWIRFQQALDAAPRTIMVLADSTLQHQHAAQLWTMAHTDLLTGLPNRSLFLDRCTQALTLARRRDTGAAVFGLDLDGFKAVNDTLGHAAGDALLQQVAQRLRARVRDSDTVARIGGDEFAVVISLVDSAASAEQVANELVASLRLPFELPQGSCRVSASVGIALYPQHATEVEVLMQFADMAMYSAKHGGKNRVHLWQETDALALPAPPPPA